MAAKPLPPPRPASPLPGQPDGTEAKGLPDNGRDRTEVVLEKAMPAQDQRKPRVGRDQKPMPK